MPARHNGPVSSNVRRHMNAVPLPASQEPPMRAVCVYLTLALCTEAFANDSCFFSTKIQDLIETSKELDECFSSADDICKLKKKSPDIQAKLNKSRLVPMNRKLGDAFMDRATGTVHVKFASGDVYFASGEKISRCHVITSAHLIFGDGDVPLTSKNYTVKFKSGQSCDTSIPWEREVSATPHFSMLTTADYACIDEPCTRRSFRGISDLVILKLDRFDENDRSFFTLNTTFPAQGQTISCFGYTGSINRTDFTSEEALMYLWSQKDARMLGDSGRHKGVLTNAESRKGMSGGGCVSPANARELVGVFTKDNKGLGNAAIDITENNVITHAPNYLSIFYELSNRYTKVTGKKLDNLDRECAAASR